MLRNLVAIGISVFVATIWAVFRVPGDPGEAPIAVPGIVRLIVEAVVFMAAVLALIDTDHRTEAFVLAGLLVIHYALDWDRLQWIVRQ